MVLTNTGFYAVGTRSGTYNISAKTYLVTNAGASTLTWSLINTSAWLSVSTNGGALAAGTGYPVVVSLNSTASNLPAWILHGQHQFLEREQRRGRRLRLFSVTNTEGAHSFARAIHFLGSAGRIVHPGSADAHPDQFTQHRRVELGHQQYFGVVQRVAR